MAKKLRRVPKNYDAVKPTGRKLADLLPQWLAGASKNFQDRPDLILLAWPEVIGEKLSSMTKAVSFVDGVLTVKVKNSSLYSLLVQHEKAKLQSRLQKRFPSVKIRNIVFRLG